jgi:hypothetical protein
MLRIASRTRRVISRSIWIGFRGIPDRVAHQPDDVPLRQFSATAAISLRRPRLHVTNSSQDGETSFPGGNTLKRIVG